MTVNVAFAHYFIETCAPVGIVRHIAMMQTFLEQCIGLHDCSSSLIGGGTTHGSMDRPDASRPRFHQFALLSDRRTLARMNVLFP